MQRTPLVTDNFYHIYNRGVEKRDIFLHEKDYIHFIHCLYEFNDQQPTIDPRIAKLMEQSQCNRSREMIVDIVAWCLMPNHFHVLVRQRKDRGVTLFMKKLGTGYAMYFNKKYERSGILFQGRFRSVHVDRDAYLLHLMRYIHLNPIDLIEAGWKERGIQRWEDTLRFLEQYRWSSYHDWIGKKNFPSLLATTIANEMCVPGDDHKNFVQQWLRNSREEIAHLILED